MRKILLAIIGLALIGVLVRQPAVLRFFDASPVRDDRQIEQAYAKRLSDLQVSGRGIVRRILPDDTHGRRHQRFILSLPSGHTLLIAHNIDIAPRIEDLREGDTVAFYGEYEWNERGGVIHWTHHDPRGRHADGWLRHNGITYQ